MINSQSDTCPPLQCLMCVITYSPSIQTSKVQSRLHRQPQQVYLAVPSLKLNTDDCIELKGEQVTLIDIVQSLGEYINDEDAIIRSKAVRFLSQVIAELPSTFLSRQQVQVLCQFLCDRIQDGGAVGGLSKLQTLGRFNKDMAIMTFRA